MDGLGEPNVTGYRSKFFRHSCPNDGCYFEQLPAWDDLIECFPRRIRPTDIDGLVEINGHFLFLEEKRAGCGPDEGQRRALLALSELPDVTVIFFRPGKRSDLECLIFGMGPAQGWQPFSRAEFLSWLTDWATESDQPPGAAA